MIANILSHFDGSILLLLLVVIAFLRGIWWVEDKFGRKEARERAMVERRPLSPQEMAAHEEELRRWLLEGEG